VALGIGIKINFVLMCNVDSYGKVGNRSTPNILHYAII
jgi:hypothetical protein